MSSTRLLALLVGSALYAGQSLAQPENAAQFTPLGTSQLVQTLLGLTAVLALIAGLVVKRFGRLPGAGGAGLRIEGGVSLGPRERVVLLNVEGTRLLVGVAPGRVQTLHVVSPALTSQELEEEMAFERDLMSAVNDGIQS